ncbi:hypothetical protein Q8G71_34635, partial [Klebsiella pneumoniae]
DKLPNKSCSLAWDAIIRGFVAVSEFSKAVQFYHLMLRQNLVPDNFTYPLVLKASLDMKEKPSSLVRCEKGIEKCPKQGIFP